MELAPPVAKRRRLPTAGRRIVFLDVDGVLNTRHTPGFASVEPGLLENVKQLVEECDAHLVLSTSWRLVSALRRRVLAALEHVEIRSERVVGDTPRVSPGSLALPSLADGPWMQRSEEIRRWLAEHEAEVESWVALDDLDLFQDDAARRERFVKTDMGSGFDAARAARAQLLLLGEVDGGACVVDVPFQAQTASLNCGATALHSALRALGVLAPTDELDATMERDDQQGVSTVKLAALAAELGAHVQFVSAALLSDPAYVQELAFYRDHGDLHGNALAAAVQRARDVGVSCEQRSVSFEELLGAVREGSAQPPLRPPPLPATASKLLSGPPMLLPPRTRTAVIVLVDFNVLQGKPQLGYMGHFVPVVGFDAERVFVHTHDRPCVGFPRELFERAWRARGTDEDVLILRAFPTVARAPGGAGGGAGGGGAGGTGGGGGGEDRDAEGGDDGDEDGGEEEEEEEAKMDGGAVDGIGAGRAGSGAPIDGCARGGGLASPREPAIVELSDSEDTDSDDGSRVRRRRHSSPPPPVGAHPLGRAVRGEEEAQDAAAAPRRRRMLGAVLASCISHARGRGRARGRGWGRRWGFGRQSSADSSDPPEGDGEDAVDEALPESRPQSAEAPPRRASWALPLHLPALSQYLSLKPVRAWSARSALSGLRLWTPSLPRPRFQWMPSMRPGKLIRRRAGTPKVHEPPQGDFPVVAADAGAPATVALGNVM